jgi:hypothetical protein
LADDQEQNQGAERRRHPRHEPYPYLPHVEILGDTARSLPRKVGFVRNESKSGFSAQFNESFPYEEGDILDVRVSYQRAWARVVWIQQVNEDLYVVGFRLHPEEFLEQSD